MKISQSTKDSFPPGEKAMPGGIKRDPDGEEYISYFLTRFVNELKEKGII